MGEYEWKSDPKPIREFVELARAEGFQPSSIDQHDSVRDLLAVLFGLARETGRGDKDAFSCLAACECSEEGLDFRTADGVSPSLCLDIDLLETESVERDDAVDAAVSCRAPEMVGSCISAKRSFVNSRVGSSVTDAGAAGRRCDRLADRAGASV